MSAFQTQTAIKPEPGYEDIYQPTPYIDTEIDGARMYIHMLYVPPHLRGQGEGTKLLQEALRQLPKNVEVVRLIACSLGSGNTLDFWRSHGFQRAYISTQKNTSRILHLAVNGHVLPTPKRCNNVDEKHYIFD